MKNYGTNELCLELLEEIRYKDGIYCPYCNSTNINVSSDPKRPHRHFRNSCVSSFSVTVGTIFHKARKLSQWLMILGLMLNAKKSKSSCEISRDLGMRQAFVWEIQNKIRLAMNTKESSLLEGIIKMGETYIGGNPRGNVWEHKRGKERIKPQLQACKKEMTNNGVSHFVINHSGKFVAGDMYTNSIEGFQSLIKRAWYGSHHHYSKKNAHLYVGETSYVYNNRKNKNLFIDTIKRMLGNFK